ncbi:hypothetical protein VE00_04210 [Pseudogymnoascus sp. WSF 3629]|nr:hypothetical protein VE00_04210 [Pseudogymnoascus sp. WSF 3629]
MAVIDAVVYHPALAHYLRFVATTVGRDKLLRTIQYFSRFYAWYLYRTNATPAAIKPFEAIKKQFGLARKAMRLGKNIEHFKSAKVAADRKDLDPVLKYAAVGRQLGYGAYLTLDAAAFLDAAGIRPTPNAKTITRNSQKAWFAGLSFSVISGLYTLWALKDREARLDKKDGESVVEGKKIQRERAAIQLQLLSDCCDLVMPTSSLGWTGFDDGIVGIAGTTSSLIGLYGAWKKTA